MNDLTKIVNSPNMKKQWQLVLPKYLTAERLARVALTQIRKVPKLTKCTQESFLSALMTCAELGIEPNGRDAHLIPYGEECTLIIDYKGLIKLAMRGGEIYPPHADIVCENDFITIKNGVVEHEIDPREERGDMIGAYVIVRYRDGGERHEYMSKAQIDTIRDRSWAKTKGPWVTDYNEMAKKTVFRRVSKWLDLAPEVMDSVDMEADRLPIVDAVDDSLAELEERIKLSDQDGPDDMDVASLKAEIEFFNRPQGYRWATMDAEQIREFIDHPAALEAIQSLPAEHPGRVDFVRRWIELCPDDECPVSATVEGG